MALLIAVSALQKSLKLCAKIRPSGPTAFPSCTVTLPDQLAWPDGEVALFRGEVEGQLTWPPRGERGFGYDPIFVPDGYTMTFGEMAPEDKHRISHRAVDDTFVRVTDCGAALRGVFPDVRSAQSARLEP